MKEKNKQKQEIFICVLLSIIFIISLNVSVVFAFMLLILFVFTIWTKFKIPKFRKDIRKFMNFLFLLLIVLCILDFITTYLAVIKLQIADEITPLIIYIWGIYGYLLGSFFIIFTDFLLFFFIKSMLNKNNRTLFLIGIVFVVAGLYVWIPVIADNLMILFDYCR